MTQTLTIPLEEAVIQQAQRIAADHSMTLQRLLSEELTSLIKQLALEHDRLTPLPVFTPTPSIDPSHWPSAIRELAGAWSDFPMAEEIRKYLGEDLPRLELAN